MALWYRSIIVLGSLTLRLRIVLLVVMAAIGLVAVIAVTIVLGTRNERQVSNVETQYVPLLVLERETRATYALIPRVLQDAASAGEPSALERADALVRDLARHLHAGAATLRANGGDADQLDRELRTYYRTARRVSAELIAGQPAAELASDIATMQVQRGTFASDLEKATTPDRDRLKEAFAVARSSQRTAMITIILVAIVSLAWMAVWSAGIIRRTLGALREVSQGMERLGRGEFDREIAIDSPDELGELARDANRTARQLVAAHRELTQKADELARASRYKSEFLANMSHELRTPLNSVLVLSALLRDNEHANLTPQQVEFAKLIHRAGQELLTMIDDVLDLAKIEAGRQDVASEEVRIADVAAYARAMFEPHAIQKKLAYRVSVDPDAPAMIVSDSQRVLQILKNLLANAFKFTEHGAIELRIAPARPEDWPGIADAAVVVEVSDTGIGIDPALHERIFQAFTQADQGTARRFGGSGLGLAIARNFATLLGGDLVVDSELGRGSTFRLALPAFAAGTAPRIQDGERKRLPAATGATPALATAGGTPAGTQDLAGRTVLVAGDDMRTLYSLANLLSSWRVQALTAADGRGMLDEAARHPELDAVLVDVSLADAEVAQLARQLRTRSEPPAIVALASDGERVRGEGLELDGVLAKPVDPEQLVALLARVTRARQPPARGRERK